MLRGQKYKVCGGQTREGGGGKKVAWLHQCVATYAGKEGAGLLRIQCRGERGGKAGRS